MVGGFRRNGLQRCIDGHGTFYPFSTMNFILSNLPAIKTRQHTRKFPDELWRVVAQQYLTPFAFGRIGLASRMAGIIEEAISEAADAHDAYAQRC